MHQVQSDVWETETERPFPGLTTHAYLLIRKEGNVLFYNTGNRADIEAFEALGGVAYHFLSHRDELGPSLNWIADRYGSRLGGHAAERDDFADYRAPDIVFHTRETLLDGIDVIPVPGHSPGSTCFLVRSPTGKRYLFTGDTLYRTREGKWRAGFIPGHSSAEDARQMVQSLESLRALAPDVVFGSAFGGSLGHEEMTSTQWQDYLDRALADLRMKLGTLSRDQAATTTDGGPPA